MAANWSALAADQRAAHAAGQAGQPGQVVDIGYRNMLTDPTALEAERLLLRTVVGALHNHPGVWMWSWATSRTCSPSRRTSETGRAWVRGIIRLIKSLDPVIR